MTIDKLWGKENLSLDDKKEIIKREINSLDPKIRNKYDEDIMGILEFKEEAIRYGIKGDDFIDLPEEKVINAKKQLYNEYMEKYNIVQKTI